MSDDIKLTYDELLQKNLQLRQTITVLRNQQEEYEKCTSRINPPNKTYKDLENKLASLESIHQDKIQELWDNHINPLQNNLKDKDIQLEYSYKANESQKERIKDLLTTINGLDTVISFAVGYISASQPHTDKHPMQVKEWLFRGINGYS
jgi:DNA repair exonuclease SbcCD ATPase subunit